MPDYQHIEVEERDSVAIVKLIDPKLLDMLDINELERELYQFVESRQPKGLVITFDSVTHCTSAVMNALLTAQQAVKSYGGTLRPVRDAGSHSGGVQHHAPAIRNRQHAARSRGRFPRLRGEDCGTVRATVGGDSITHHPKIRESPDADKVPQPTRSSPNQSIRSINSTIRSLTLPCRLIHESRN